jgi:hypothetical protein
MSEPKRRGRKPFIAPDELAPSWAQLRWWITRLLNDGHSPDAVCHALKKLYGVRLVVTALREFIATQPFELEDDDDDDVTKMILN